MTDPDFRARPQFIIGEGDPRIVQVVFYVGMPEEQERTWTHAEFWLAGSTGEGPSSTVASVFSPDPDTLTESIVEGAHFRSVSNISGVTSISISPASTPQTWVLAMAYRGRVYYTDPIEFT